MTVKHCPLLERKVLNKKAARKTIYQTVSLLIAKLASEHHETQNKQRNKQTNKNTPNPMHEADVTSQGSRAVRQIDSTLPRPSWCQKLHLPAMKR